MILLNIDWHKVRKEEVETIKAARRTSSISSALGNGLVLTILVLGDDVGRLYHLFKHWPLRRGHQSPLCSVEGYTHVLRLRRDSCISGRHLGTIRRPAIPPVPLPNDGWMGYRCITPRAPPSLGSATASLFAVAHVGQLHESPFGESQSEDLIFLYKTLPAQSIILRGFNHAKESRWRISLPSPLFLHFRA